MLDSAEKNAHSKGKDKRKRSILYLALLVTVLVVATAGVAVVVQSQKKASDGNSSKSYVHPVVKSTCATTLYPDLCISAIANAPAATSSRIKTPKDVLLASLNQTITNVHQNYRNVRSITFARTSLTKREKVALHDCLVTIDDTLAELHKTLIQITHNGNQFKNYSFQQIEEVKTLISAAMTNQETCLDGFSQNKAEKAFRKKSLEGRLMYVFRLCSNVLAMFKNLTAEFDSNNPKGKVENSVHGRRLSWADDNEHEWPYWLSAGDRRLLQTGSVTPDVTVAADGSGNYKTVSEAVAAAPGESSNRYIIKIKAGVYRENVEVPRSKTNLMFIGDGQKTTIITARRNVNEGGTTFNSSTVAVVGEGFLARDITFQNTAGPEGEQAVALRVNADSTAFYKCGMIAYQDTLYVHSLRQFYHTCYIAGTVDFIFGNAAAVFQNCDIHARKPGPKQKNMVTAQGRDDPNQNTGIVIQRCRIGATTDLLPVISEYPTYLGRPWKNYSRTVIMLTDISDIINPAGWYEWNGTFALDTLYYAEYQNTGAGADTSNRVTWKGYRVLTSSAEAESFTPENFIDGSHWLGSTGFPYTLGL